MIAGKQNNIKNEWRDMIYSSFSKLAEIPLGEWEELISLSRYLHLEKDDYLIKEGEIPDKIGFILSGICRDYYITEEGDEKNFSFRDKGWMAGSFRAFHEQRSSWFNIQALEATDVLFVDFKAYRSLLDRHNCWRIIREKYFELLYLEKEKREKGFLSENTEERYRNFKKEYPGLEHKVCQYYIASYLGITPVTLSRIKNQAG